VLRLASASTALNDGIVRTLDPKRGQDFDVEVHWPVPNAACTAAVKFNMDRERGKEVTHSGAVTGEVGGDTVVVLDNEACKVRCG